DAFSPRYMEDFDDRSEAAFSDASSQPSRASAAQTAKQGKQKMRQQLAQLREAEEQERQVAESRRPVFRFWRKAPDPPSRPAVTTTLEQDRAARAASRAYEAQVAEMAMAEIGPRFGSVFQQQTGQNEVDLDMARRSTSRDSNPVHKIRPQHWVLDLEIGESGRHKQLCDACWRLHVRKAHRI
ncbi:unnamed protein product, partial [Polarella glacialis]